MRRMLLGGLVALATTGCMSLPKPEETLERYYTALRASQLEQPVQERLEVTEPALARLIREHNRTVKGKEYQLLAAKERYAGQQADYLPQLKLVSGAGLATGPSRTAYGGLVLEQRLPGGFAIAPSVTRDDQQLTTYALSVTLPIPGLTAGAAADQLIQLERYRDLNKAGAEYAQVFRGRFREALSAYYDAAVVDTIVDNQKDYLKQLRVLGDILGKDPPAQYQSDIASAESRLSQKRTELSGAKARLNRSLGLPLEQRLSIDLPPQKPVPGDEAALLRQAVRADPELLDSAVQLAVDDATIAAAGEGRLPKLSVIGGGTIDRHRENDWTLGLGLELPLFDGSRSVHQKRQAAYGKRATECRIEQRMLDIQYDLHRAFLALQDGGERIPLLKTNVEHATKAADDAISQFRAGKLPYGVVVPQLDALRAAKDDLAGTLRSYAENRTLIELITGAYDKR